MIGFDADAAARLVAQGPRDQQLAELARLDRRGGQGPVVAGTALRAVLDDPVVPPGGLDGDPAFMDVVAARFFDVDVLARLAAPDRDQGVPVVGRGDRDRVDRLCPRARGGCPERWPARGPPFSRSDRAAS